MLQESHETTSIEAPTISYPKGGGAIKGMGETFRPDSFSGTGSYAIPIGLTPARGFEPKLSLSYSSANGNGVFGMGFNVTVSKITLLTSLGIPKYDGSDTYLYNGVELVLKENQTKKAIGGVMVLEYFERIEGSFSTIRQHIDTTTNTSSWEVIEADNTVRIFGTSNESRVYNPEDSSKVFEWLLDSATDSRGNKQLYTYKSENSVGVPIADLEGGHSFNNKYIKSIQYGNYLEKGSESYAFDLIFDYGEHDLSMLQKGGVDPYDSSGDWEYRPDSFSSFTSGFEIRTCRRCLHLLLFHRFKNELGDPSLVKLYGLTYSSTDVYREVEISNPSVINSFVYTGLCRRGTDALDGYDVQSMPPIEFEFSKFFAPSSPEFSTLSSKGNPIPGYIDASSFLQVDLNSEGISGFLFTGDDPVYLAPEGNGEYSLPSAPENFPISSQLGKSNFFSDLDGNGKIQLVSMDPDPGYYPRLSDDSWGNFQSFPNRPSDRDVPSPEYVGLNHNGKTDILITELEGLTLYESAGTKGYANPQSLERPGDFPLLKRDDAQCHVGFEDVFGDGLPHRIYLSNGVFRCWPNLGYGQFGTRIDVSNAPDFEGEFDRSRLYFADINGSGTADVIYAYSDRVDVYLNQNGNAFADPLSIVLPEAFTNIDRIHFSDVLGNGTTCLVFTKIDETPRHYFYNFVGEFELNGSLQDCMKPFMLCQIDNNLGAVTQVTFTSSTEFYLSDKKNGRPWLTKLPFPVQVVKKVVVQELNSGARYANRYAYHDGYYDPIERTFRGFGYVETWDAEDFLEYKTNVPPHVASRMSDTEYVQPVYQRIWFHTGAAFDKRDLISTYQGEFYQGDKDAYPFPHTRWDTKLDSSTSEEQRQAFAALRGLWMRKETYGESSDDEPSVQSNPLSVEEQNHKMEVVQSKGEQRYAVFMRTPSESISYRYESNPEDPRVQQKFVLQTDTYGNVILNSVVNVPRRKNPSSVIHPQQLMVYATLEWSGFVTPPSGTLFCHQRCEHQVLELHGLDLSGENYMTLHALSEKVKQLGLPKRDKIIPYMGSTTSGFEAVQVSWNRVIFWNDAQNAPFTLGKIGNRGLVHHKEKAAFGKDFSVEVFEGRLIDSSAYGKSKGYLENVLYTHGGYFYEEDSGYWWNKGLTSIYYDSSTPGNFFQLQSVVNTFAEETLKGKFPQSASLCSSVSLKYDEPYQLVNTHHIQTVDTGKVLETVSYINYNYLLAYKVVDVNSNSSEALFDPLGQVVVSSIVGTEDGKPAGAMTLYRSGAAAPEYSPLPKPKDIQDVINNPDSYLQGASSYFFYDIECWSKSKKPSSAVHLQRSFHWHSPQRDEKPYCKVKLNYSDGLGRSLESREMSNLKPDMSASPRWQVSGRIVYNNKGGQLNEYLPFYSNTFEYEGVDANPGPGANTTYYDAIGRVVKVVSAKGFFSKKVYTAWDITEFDKDDTVLEAPYYLKNFPSKVSPAEKAALIQAIKFYNTPITKVLDNRGHILFEIENNLGNVSSIDFDKAVEGSKITAIQVFDALKTAGYIEEDASKKGFTWVTKKFQAYQRGFKLNLPSAFSSVEESVAEVLRQNILTSSFETDMLDRNVTRVDPRLFYLNVTKGSQLANFRYSYPMESKEPIVTVGVDTGKQVHLQNIFKQQFWSFSARSYCQLITYDLLQRRKELFVKKIAYEGVVKDYATFNWVEDFTYGESQPNAADSNLNGSLFRLKDLSRILTNHSYSILNQVQWNTKQLVKEYKTPVDWNVKVPLETDQFQQKFEFNALKLPVVEHLPDGSKVTKSYLQTGQLFSVHVDFSDKSQQPIVQSSAYDAAGNKTEISLGNGVVQKLEYEATTQRLLSKKSTRKSGAGTAPLQSLEYTYDPVGNITQCVDTSIESVYKQNQKVDPSSNYTYDALYRLIEASGRQHIGISLDTYKNNIADGSFLQSIWGPTPTSTQADQLENYTERFTYDSSGNLVEVRHMAKSKSWTRALPVESKSNHLKGLSYDESGNLRTLQINNNAGLYFNCCENLVKAAVIERPTPQYDDADYYVYDKDEIRTRKVSEKWAHGSTTSRIIDQCYIDNFIVSRTYQGASVDPKNLKSEYQSLRVMDGTSCLAVIDYMVESGQRQTRMQLSDLLGSVTIELDENAKLISYEEYYPFGGTSIVTGDNKTEVELKRYRYSGKERDQSTGLYYYGQRYYVPWMCRWLKPDPAGTIDGLNIYAFVKGNPITNKDTDGLSMSSSSSNKYEWEVKGNASYVTSDYDLHQVLSHFGHPTTDVVKTYTDLADRVKFDLKNHGAFTKSTVDDLHLMFDAMEPLHFDHNPILGVQWADDMTSYTGQKRKIPLYSVMRSKATTSFKGIHAQYSTGASFNLNEHLYAVSGRPAEVHHILFKAIYPEYANQTPNLMLTQRSAKESVDGPGQHELMHMVASGNHSDKFKVIQPEFTAEYEAWVGKPIQVFKIQ